MLLRRAAPSFFLFPRQSLLFSLSRQAKNKFLLLSLWDYFMQDPGEVHATPGCALRGRTVTFAGRRASRGPAEGDVSRETAQQASLQGAKRQEDSRPAADAVRARRSFQWRWLLRAAHSQAFPSFPSFSPLRSILSKIQAVWAQTSCVAHLARSPRRSAVVGMEQMQPSFLFFSAISLRKKLTLGGLRKGP